jgi:hypothetical protein
VLLQEVWENHRAMPVSTINQSWSESIVTNITSLASGHSYDGFHMREADPPHWSTSIGISIQSMNDVDIAEGYEICADWKFDINQPLLTDKQGWQYNRDFVVEGWVPASGSDSAVRHRKWFRILVSSEHITAAKKRLTEFSNNRRDFRSLHPGLIKAALPHWYYQLQFVMECQRYDDGTFSADNLRAPGMHDPPQWCVGAPDSCLVDPSDVPVTELYDGLHLIETNPHGSDCLTEFMFTVYPNRDPSGWQYNTSFQAQTPWSQSILPGYGVRRRVWFRSIVPNKQLYLCRRALQEYIELHPRGVVKTGMLHRLSHFRKRWTAGIATLTDRALVLRLQHNYQSEVQYTLEGCEVVGHLAAEELTAALASPASSLGATETPLIPNEHPFLFGLRLIGAEGKDGGLQCVLGASSREQREEWVLALTHQVALVNPFFWALSFGPPIADSVIIQGDM